MSGVTVPKRRFIERIDDGNWLYAWVPVATFVIGTVGLVAHWGSEPLAPALVPWLFADMVWLGSLMIIQFQLGILLHLRITLPSAQDDCRQPGYFPNEDKDLSRLDQEDWRRGIEKGVLIGTVAALDPPFEGPDGHWCVAALLVEPQDGRQSRWSTFWVETPEQRIAVCVHPEVLETIVATSWRREAARPRWFRGRAFRPELAPGEHFDWVCVREGDLVVISSSRLEWDPPRRRLPLRPLRPLRAAFPEDGEEADGEEYEDDEDGEEVAGDEGELGTGTAMPSLNPYRASSKVVSVRLRGLEPGGDVAILLDVLSREWTRRWAWRAEFEGTVLGMSLLLGFDLLLFAVLMLVSPGDLVSPWPWVAALVVGFGLFGLGLGASAAERGWWQRRPATTMPPTRPWGYVEDTPAQHKQRSDARRQTLAILMPMGQVFALMLASFLYDFLVASLVVLGSGLMWFGWFVWPTVTAPASDNVDDQARRRRRLVASTLVTAQLAAVILTANVSGFSAVAIVASVSGLMWFVYFAMTGGEAPTSPIAPLSPEHQHASSGLPSGESAPVVSPAADFAESAGDQCQDGL